MDLIDTGTRVFPGGMKLLADGTWIAVHQRDAAPAVAGCWAQEAPSILGPWSEPVLLSVATVASYDPGVTRLDDGTVIATAWGSSVSYYAIRLGPGEWGPWTALRKDKKLGFISDEQTVRRIRDHTSQLYSRKPKAAPEHAFDLVYRRLGPGPSIVSEQVIAASFDANGALGIVPLGTGQGPPNKQQKRATLADLGDGHSVIAAWSRYTGGYDREVWTAISPDDGTTWGPPELAVAYPGQDLANPFILQAADGLRVYFATTRKGLCHAHFDEAWGSIIRDTIDPDAATARIVVARVGDQLYGLCTNHDFTGLGIVPLPA